MEQIVSFPDHGSGGKTFPSYRGRQLRQLLTFHSVCVTLNKERTIRLCLKPFVLVYRSTLPMILRRVDGLCWHCHLGLGQLLETSEGSPQKSPYLSRGEHYPAECQSFQNAQQIQNITGIRTTSVGSSTSVKLHAPNPSPPEHAMSSTLSQGKNELRASEMGYCTAIPTVEVYHSSQNQLVPTTIQHRSHAHQGAVRT